MASFLLYLNVEKLACIRNVGGSSFRGLVFWHHLVYCSAILTLTTQSQWLLPFRMPVASWIPILPTLLTNWSQILSGVGGGGGCLTTPLRCDNLLEWLRIQEDTILTVLQFYFKADALGPAKWRDAGENCRAYVPSSWGIRAYHPPSISDVVHQTGSFTEFLSDNH